jgi:hypothetical protein
MHSKAQKLVSLIKQISTNYAPFSIEVHCMAHKCIKNLSCLGVVSNIEDLLQSYHAYFAHSTLSSLSKLLI